MAKIQQVRRRIKSVRNINQITKAMEMVAASKLRRAQESAQASRMYATAAREALARLRQLNRKSDHELFAKRPVKNRLIILFSSDRGLAGAYNSNIFKALVELVKRDRAATPAIADQIIIIGNKGGGFAAKLKKDLEIIGVYRDWPMSPTTVDLQPIVRTALDRFRRRQADTVTVLYTDFVSIVKQAAVASDVLPIAPEQILPADAAADVYVKNSVFEPSPAAVLTYIVPRFIETQIFQANLEAIASEQAMRMVAMKNASDNAKDLISDLTLEYNGARQAAITQELAEITTGAQAIT